MKTFRDLDGPFRLPIVGNAHQLRPDTMQAATEQWADRYPPLYRIKVGPVNLAVLSDAETIETVYAARPDSFRPLRKLQSAVDEIGARGLFVSEGDTWRRQRALIETGLSAIPAEAWWPALVRTLDRMKNKLEAHADSGRDVDMCPEVARLTVDLATELVLGSSFNAVQSKDVVLVGLLNRLGSTIVRRLYSPIWYWRWFRLPGEHSMHRQVADFREQVCRIIDDTRERLDGGAKSPPGFFLQAALGNINTGAQPAFSDRELFANSASLLMESHSTVPGALAWLTYYLARHPQYAEAIRAEIASHGEPTQAPADPVDFARCPALCAFVDETMRLKPPVTFSALEPVDDTEIHGHVLRAGTMIIVLHRHPSLQDDHFTNARRFLPERWLDGDAASACARRPGAWLRFGFGPRMCPGHNHGLLQLRAFLAMFCWYFDAKLADSGREVQERQGLTMRPASLRLRLERRRPGRSGAS